MIVPAVPERIGSAGEWFDIAGFVVNTVAGFLATYDLKALFDESFRVRRPLRRNSEVKLMELDNLFFYRIAFDLKKGIDSFFVRAALFLLGMWFFPSLPIRFSFDSNF